MADYFDAGNNENANATSGAANGDAAMEDEILVSDHIYHLHSGVAVANLSISKRNVVENEDGRFASERQRSEAGWDMD
jgi:hypothetical protein